MRLRGGAVIALGLATLIFAAPTLATQRYAAPSGSGPKAECPQGNPCALKDALAGAEENDEVIVTSGAYTVTETIFAGAEGLSIHGDPAGPMPTISAKLNNYAMQVYAGSVISYLDLTDTAEEGTPLFCLGARVERVRLTAIGKGARGLYQGPDCDARDSVVLASGEGATALNTVGANETTNVTRNVTAIAQGPDSVGISAINQELFSPLSGVHTLDLKNTIAQGERVDLLARRGIEYPSEIFVSNSNFDRAAAEGTSKVIDLGGNQTAQPLFANAAGGDYHEAGGSPTIDGGIADQLGPTDFDGHPRTLGPAPDIGAFEAPPAAQAPVAGTILSLTIAPNAFKPANVGGAIVSVKKKTKAPVSAKVTYSLSAAATVVFGVERKLPGRKVGKRCVKQTKANRTKKRCSRFKPVKGSFTHSGQAGQNTFKFSGRVVGKALKPGHYRLVGKTGSVSKRASFRLVK